MFELPFFLQGSCLKSLAVCIEQKKIDQWRSQHLAYEVQLLDPEYLAKCSSFSNLVMAWLVRLVDPKKQHPHVRIE